MSKLKIYRAIGPFEEILLNKYNVMNLPQKRYFLSEKKSTFDYQKYPFRKHFYLDKDYALWNANRHGNYSTYEYTVPEEMVYDYIGAGKYDYRDIDYISSVYFLELGIPNEEIINHLSKGNVSKLIKLKLDILESKILDKPLKDLKKDNFLYDYIYLRDFVDFKKINNNEFSNCLYNDLLACELFLEDRCLNRDEAKILLK